MTIVAITGTTLVTLKYNNHHDIDDTDFMANNDSNEVDSYINYQTSPKFNYKSDIQNDKRIVKRSSDEDFTPRPQYDISDRNFSIIDEAKREKIREVHDF
jgi:hypothetical protein